MKHTNKKGFTIVELVIVIAVIAILAAVLIPTFSNLIKKANISNDTAIAKNLNTAAISAQADTFGQAIEAAKEAGYLVAHLNAKADNIFFVWEDETNQFLLYDLDAKKVLYSNTKEYGDPDASWYFAVNTKAEKDTVLAALANVNCNYLVGDITAVKDVLAAGGEVYLDESLTIDSENRIVVKDATDDVVINFTNSSVSTTETITGIPVEIVNGNVTINDAVVGGSGSFENEHGTFSTAVGFDGNAHLVLNNCTITGKGNAVAGSNNDDGPAYVELNNCTLISDNICFQLATWGTGVLNNVTVTSGTAGDTNAAIFASFGANITINGGNYTSNGTSLLYINGVNDSYTEKSTIVTINSGEFTFNQLVVFAGITTKTNLVINGGTFNCATLTWDVLQQYVTAGETVVLNGTSYTK